jgi:hypothetical protein
MPCSCSLIGFDLGIKDSIENVYQGLKNSQFVREHVPVGASS